MCAYTFTRGNCGEKKADDVIFIEFVRLISLSFEEFDSIVINARHYTNHCALVARESCVIAVVDVHSLYALHIFLDMCSK